MLRSISFRLGGHLPHGSVEPNPTRCLSLSLSKVWRVQSTGQGVGIAGLQPGLPHAVAVGLWRVGLHFSLSSGLLIWKSGIMPVALPLTGVVVKIKLSTLPMRTLWKLSDTKGMLGTVSAMHAPPVLKFKGTKPMVFQFLKQSTYQLLPSITFSMLPRLPSQEFFPWPRPKDNAVWCGMK